MEMWTDIVATLTLVLSLVAATWMIRDKIATVDKDLGDKIAAVDKDLGDKIIANATAIAELRGVVSELSNTVSGLRDAVLSHIGGHSHPTVATKSENSE